MDLFEVKNVKQVKSIIVSTYRIRKTEQGGWFNKKQVLTEEKVDDSKAVFSNGLISKMEERKKGFQPIVTLYRYYNVWGKMLQYGANRCKTTIKISDDDDFSRYYQAHIHHKEDGKSYFSIYISHYNWDKQDNLNDTIRSTKHYFNYYSDGYWNLGNEAFSKAEKILPKILMIEKIISECTNVKDKDLKDLVIALSHDPFGPCPFVNDVNPLLFSYSAHHYNYKRPYAIYDIEPSYSPAYIGEKTVPLKDEQLTNKTQEYNKDGYGNWIECRCYDQMGNYTDLFTRTIEYVD